MLYSIKTTAILAASLALVSACSSSTVSQKAATEAPVAAMAESGSMLEASPVNLQKLAALSASENAQAGSQIEPAKAVTFEIEDLSDAETGLESVPLPVIQPDSSLLDGTVYRGTTVDAS